MARGKVSHIGEDVMDSLRVYHDPMSTATSQPRIPDGKVAESVGFTNRFATQVTTPDNQDILHFMLFPGYNSQLMYGTHEADANESSSLSGRLNRSIRTDGMGFVSYVDLHPGGVPTDGDVALSQGLSMWRNVSTGLVLSLLNPAEEDDGWWEACRVHAPKGDEDFIFTTVPAVTNTAQGMFVPETLFNNLKGRDIQNEKSYVTGLLRHLQFMQFQLAPRNEHDFKGLQRRYYCEADNIQSYTTATRQLVPKFGTTNFGAIANDLYDWNYDAIYIRLHCRPTAGQTSRFHVDLKTNLELVYEGDKDQRRYQTPTANLGAAMGVHTAANKSANEGGANIKTEPKT